MKLNIKFTVLIISTIFFPGSVYAALFERLGGLAYYDNVLDITWLTDANYAKTSGYDRDGLMSWNTASTWAASLDINGITGWRLPTMIDTGADGCDYSVQGGTDCGYNVQTGTANTTVYSEMASLWTDTLGNLPRNNVQFGLDLINTGPFINLEPSGYWVDLQYALSIYNVWEFSTLSGFQRPANKLADKYSWVVHSGDVSPVPLPASVWLFGSGFIGLIGLVRRNNNCR